jgi:predicted peptidase
MRLLFCLLIAFHSFFCNAQDFSAYEKHYFNTTELNLPYRLLRPLHQEAEKKYPLLIFLHGAFERGFDNERQLDIGGRFFLRDSIRTNYASYVLFPQCPESDVWAYFEASADPASGKTTEIRFPFPKKATDVSSALKKLIDSLVDTDSIDPKRIYIAALSQGGMGVLDFLARYPDLFAAGLSICGAGNVTTVRNFSGKSALWLFHGEDDDVIPVSFSRTYFKKLRKLSADVRYSEYAGVKHNSWVNAFNEPDFLHWLFSKNK